jgi:DNA (cytosine-5)-methyltransferase 1
MQKSRLSISLDSDLNEYLRKASQESDKPVSELITEALRQMISQSRRETQSSVGGEPTFTFIDLFAGIGGFRRALNSLGGQCVFTSEWDKYCQKTYEANYGEKPHGDITTIPPHAIPDHDILAAGFPCQPFSIAGVSKKKSLGRAHGFADKTQGTLFFNVASIIKEKRPKVFLLENVKNLKSHDRGNTFRVITETLEELGYSWFSQIVDANGYVPQHRERIFIIGFDRTRYPGDIPFQFPTPPPRNLTLESILSRQVEPRYTLTPHLWNYLQRYAEKHREKGNGFGFGLVGPKDTARTLSARYYKDGSEILVKATKRNTPPRRLTPAECARLMGYGEDFQIVVSDTQAYKQFGNSVVVPVIRALGEKILQTMATLEQLNHRPTRHGAIAAKPEGRFAIQSLEPAAATASTPQ